MYIPSSTYRIQFNSQYNFKNLANQLQYLSSLGIGALYASPVFAAVPGSNHGYDVTSSLVFNEEIGTNEEFEHISNFLKSHNIGWIQDIVPNHMAFHPDNQWLMDVLEKGRQSAYAGYFDIDWNHPVFKDKVMVPILGKTPEQAINNREIKLIWQNGGLYISYYNFTIPASGESFHDLLEDNKLLEGSFVGQGIASDEYKNDPAFRGFGWSNSRERYQAIYETDSSFESMIDNLCEEVNSDAVKLTELLAKQHFVLTYWQDVEKNLNYRRFFTINGLISLAMEKPNVFEDYHAFIHEKVMTGKFQGLRVDHVDGLKSPNMYFERLRAKMGEDTFIVVEKILEHHEELQKDWPLEGSSGYDFLALVNNVFTNRAYFQLLMNFYDELKGSKLDPEEVIYQKKKMILTQSFRGDWDNIYRMIAESELIDEKVSDEDLQEAVGEFLINCPVYKLYSDNLPLETEDVLTVREIFEKSVRRAPHLSASLHALRNIFLNEYDDSRKKARALDIFLKCMQYTGPLMAKGVEDTAMYTWSAFIAHNEVGDAIDARGISIEDFHNRMIDRRNHYPKSINATATHDTKRGEDARARLNAISDLAPEWMQLVKQWIDNNQKLKTVIDGNPVPDFDEEYFIYQTLLGVFPMDGKKDAALPDRLRNYLEKALREAKIHSNWNKPDEAYEKAVIDFVEKLLDEENNFISSFLSFLKKLIPNGIVNSLSQVVLKCTCPGIPDFYQGTELWDLSLVDPDNRRPVDYKKREELLDQLKGSQQDLKEDFFAELLKNKEDGRLKLWLTHKLMTERASKAEMFVTADYLPLEVKGELKDYILAFARKSDLLWYVTIVPLHAAMLREKNNKAIDWDNTTVIIPQNAPDNWILLWDNSLIKGSHLPLSKVLKGDYPAVLKGELSNTGRGSGVLLHITSLPGKYGTGDLGNEAFKFVDSLRRANQTYWQMLPFNPVGGSFSPYSSSSAFAGNTTFIDPEDLYKRHLLNNLPEPVSEANTADFTRAEILRSNIIDEAFNNYVLQNSPLLQKRFEDFCVKENYWLNDFALFNILKNDFKNRPWNEWPDNLKTRDKENLDKYQEKFAPVITRIKFGQFLFTEQFKKLKAYANSQGLKLIGDMPIYVSYDSSDVWANPGLFDLDSDYSMKSVAGVPPDYFSETGQLWNMPIYNWSEMESNGYQWWKRRIRKNLEYCDLLRFDHFRGFSSYWRVPAGEKTAINGQWIKGPANSLFEELKKEFPAMPFIAEDLGDIDADVYKLRDDFELPGMKVLQFAFGDNMPFSIHIPHNHVANSIVYTGTHDNNTLKGWYKHEINKPNRNRIKQYLNRNIKSTNATEEFIRMAYGSVARIVIIPVQDILDLDESARINNPSNPEGNWTWKLKTNDFKTESIQYLKRMTELYGRTT